MMNASSAAMRDAGVPERSWPERRPFPLPTAGLSPAPGREIGRAAGVGITMTAAPGQTIVVEGDRIEQCFRILSGAVRLYKALADGRRQVIDFRGPGDCFGFLGAGRYTYSVEAVSEATLARHLRPAFESQVRHQAGLAQALLELAHVELEQAQRHMLLLGRKSADEKVASFLLMLAEGTAAAGPPASTFHLPMSRQDMADYLGLTIETVSRTFTRLTREGLIALPTPQRVVLLRPDELQARAEGCA